MQILANFGADLAAHPFHGDYDAILHEATQQLHARILATRLPQAGKAQDVVGQLVFG